MERSGSEVKISTAKKILQWLPTALAQVKTGGNTFENWLNEIRETLYPLLQKKKGITKKVCNNITNLMRL